MKLTTRLGIAMLLASAVTLSPAVMASTGSTNVACNQKSETALNVRSASESKSVTVAVLGPQKGVSAAHGATATR